MKRLKIIVLVLLLVGLSSSHLLAQDADDIEIKNIKKIIGTWEMRSLYDKNKQVTTNDKNTIQTIQFNNDGKYVMYGANTKLDSGLYRVNESLNILYLEGADGSVPSEWQIAFNKGTLTMSGRGSLHAQRYKYTFTRTSLSGGDSAKESNIKNKANRADEPRKE